MTPGARMIDSLMSKYNYWMYIVLMMIGFYAMIGKKNLVKKLIGMNIFQTAIILYSISIGVKKGGTLPVLMEGVPHAAAYVNPLPHVLMLTAIVVSVSTTGVALAVLLLIYRRYKTLEEDEILKLMR
jgi:multicomponent Na+:H+ antiporter subunit C